MSLVALLGAQEKPLPGLKLDLQRALPDKPPTADEVATLENAIRAEKCVVASGGVVGRDIRALPPSLSL